MALARQFFEGSSHGMVPGFSMQHPADLTRMSETNARPGMNQAWAIEQQQMRAYEESAKAAWATEFSSAPQTSSSAHPIQQGIPGRPECMS